MFTRIDHVGFVVHNIDEAVEFYTRVFEVTEWELLMMPEHQMQVAITRVDDMLLELIAPTSEQTSFAKFLQERGPSMHHIAYCVDDIEATLAQVKARGVQLIDETPRHGIHGTLVAFLHPKSTQGVLIELVQHQTLPTNVC